MYVLIKICYVCLKDKSNIKRVNDSNAINREILGIFRHFSVNLNWAKTKHNLLLCEDCCSKLLELNKFAKMCNKNSKILQDYVSLLNEVGSSKEHVEAHLSVILVGKSGMNYKVELKTEEDTIIDHQKIAEDVTESLEFDIKEEKAEKTDAEIDLDGHISSEPESESTTIASSDSCGESCADDVPAEDTAKVTTDNVDSGFRYDVIDVAEPSALAEYINEINYKVKLVTQEYALTDSRQITTEVTETLNYEIDIKEEAICKSEKLDVEYKKTFKEKTDSDIILHEYDEVINSCVGGFIGFTYQEIGATNEHSVIMSKAITAYETLYTKSQLHQHNRIHTNEEYYKCTICNKHFRTKRSLSGHKRIHSDKRLVCSFCSKPFDQKINLIQHERTHTGERPYKCSVCDKLFTTKSNLCRHEYIHTNIKSHKCSLCNKQFNQKSVLVRHERTHTGERPYKCSVCNKCFSTKGSLCAHKYIHTEFKPHKCSFCNKQFNQKCYLSKHEHTHTGERPYKCSFCNNFFKTKGTLTSHISVHTDFKRHKCTVCNKLFIRKSSLIIHARTHTDERPYKCSLCNKSFRTKYHLNRHEYTHTDFKPHKCSVCNKQFIRKSCLIKHEHTHTAERPFKCAICHKYFSSKAYLTAHCRIHSRGK